MWTSMFIFLGLIACSFVVLLFGLVRAGRRADAGEEKIFEIISVPLLHGIIEEEKAATPRVAVAK